MTIMSVLDLHGRMAIMSLLYEVILRLRLGLGLELFNIRSLQDKHA